MAMPMGSFPEGEILPLDEVIEAHMVYALRRCKGNTAEAARLLGIGRSTLYRRAKKFSIEKYLESRRPLE